MKLGLQLGYWTAQPQSARDLVARATFAEGLGFDSIWTGESWSSDAFSPLAAVAAATTSREALHRDRADLRAHARPRWRCTP